MRDTKWMNKALCKGYDPEIWFSTRGSKTEKARKICQSCQVILECRIYGLTMSLETDKYRVYGVWGGVTSYERRDKRVAQQMLAKAEHDLKERVSYGSTGSHR